MVDSCTRFIKGVVLKNKEAPIIVTAIHEGWICNYGYPSVRFWADNGKEFANLTLSELGAKAGFQIQYGPAYSPWCNGTNERNHASADVIVDKIREEDRKISLPKAVAMAAWTHNSNINYSGYSPLQLVTGKSVILPGITYDTPTTNSGFDADNIRQIIQGHHQMMKDYITAEFTKKLVDVSGLRREKYTAIKYKPGDKVYFQRKDDKAWYGPVKVVSHDENSVFVIDRNELIKVNIMKCMPYDERQHNETIDIDNEATPIEEPLQEEPDTIARRTRSKSVSFADKMNELKQDKVGVYYSKIQKSEDLSDESVLRVEVPTKHHGRPDVLEAKKAEMDNLNGYNTWTEVPYTGQDLIKLKWVITESENHDGQKQKVKGRLVCKGFMESIKPQSDSPTIGRSHVLIYTAVAANCKFHIWAIDIKGAYLQSNELDRDIFVQPPPDIQKEIGDDVVWRLNKPMYGLDDSGRKFYLKVKEILLGMGFEVMHEDNAFFYLRQDGELIAMISCHVDDFKIAASEDFGQKIIDAIALHLTISKIEKNKFRFTGVDFHRTDESITISMEAYAHSIEKIEQFRACKKEEELTKTEHKMFRKKVGQLAWLAANARPDISIQVQNLSQKSSKPTMGDLKKINHVVDLVKSKGNNIVFKHVDQKENLRIYGVSDASWSVKDRPVSGTVYMLGSTRNNNVSPLTWKSRAITGPTKCVKDAETRSLSSNAEKFQICKNDRKTAVWKCPTKTRSKMFC